MRRGELVVMGGRFMADAAAGEMAFQLDQAVILKYIISMEKKMDRILRRLRGEPGLSVDERLLFARSLAASPDERWRLHENFLRSHDLYTRSSRKKYGFKSPA